MNRTTENSVALEQRNREVPQESPVGDAGSLDEQKLAETQHFNQKVQKCLLLLINVVGFHYNPCALVSALIHGRIKCENRRHS